MQSTLFWRSTIIPLLIIKIKLVTILPFTLLLCNLGLKICIFAYLCLQTTLSYSRKYYYQIRDVLFVLKIA